MTEYTIRHSLPYPTGDNAVVVHTDIANLAKRTDISLGGIQDALTQTTQELNQSITQESQRVETASKQYTDTELEEAMQPRLELVATGMYEITAPYLDNISPGVYEIGA